MFDYKTYKINLLLILVFKAINVFLLKNKGITPF